MKSSLGIIFSFLLLFLSLYSKGQTIYGVSGIIKTPNAYIVDTGKCVMGVTYFKDYHSKHDNLTKQWAVNFNIGVYSRLELGVRLSILPDILGDSPIYDANLDRMLNGKFILLKEKKLLPQISLGIQDMVGTRYHSSTYLVISKDIKMNKSFNLILNLGYGTKLNDLIFGEAGNHNFIGLFGSTEIGFKERIYLMAEYDGRDINSGLEIAVTDWLSFNFSLLDMEIPSAGLLLKFTL